jgi:anti-sigma regulatory factor (Ser/Thr protein kinase)
VCRVAAAEFEADLTSPAAARNWVASRLDAWQLNGLSEASVLLTSELVANAVIHASGHPTMTISVADGVLEVGVTDLDPHLPSPVHHGAAHLHDGGRGLPLVEAVADEWGAVSLAAGKHIWFRMDIHDWPYLAACRCQEPGPDRVRLKSGRYALHMPGPNTDAGGPQPPDIR